VGETSAGNKVEDREEEKGREEKTEEEARKRLRELTPLPGLAGAFLPFSGGGGGFFAAKPLVS
jgi:hypothetical protein